MNTPQVQLHQFVITKNPIVRDAKNSFFFFKLGGLIRLDTTES